MYIFEVTYENMETLEQRKIIIRFDGQCLNSEQECYIYAMQRAYGNKQPNECLANIEFIAS